MTQTRLIRRVSHSRPTLEGAGVHLKRCFGFGDEKLFDPFLLMDDFRGDDPVDYLKGFPWHPHRGIETITYVTAGEVAHGDSMGNEGVITPGDVQWMTAGSGIIHQEMPKGDDKGRMHGFQLWANLPSTQKMMDPRYRDVKSNQIPEVKTGDGARIKVISGRVEGKKGPVQDIVIDPQYLDITLPGKVEYVHPTHPGHTVFAYIIDGECSFPDTGEDRHANNTLVLFEDGDSVRLKAGEQGTRLLLISGMPLGEPIAWYGPIVMNTDEELDLALKEYQDGTFIKHA